jgi:Ca2+-binding EF-hand superfamily protein
MNTFEKWFGIVDRNGDLLIDAQELAAYLKKITFTESKTFYNKL